MTFGFSLLPNPLNGHPIHTLGKWGDHELQSSGLPVSVPRVKIQFPSLRYNLVQD